MFSEYEGSRIEFLKILVEQGEEPAFLRRSREVQESLERLHQGLADTREELLSGPKIRLKVLAGRLQSNWCLVGEYLEDASRFHEYETLFNDWEVETSSSVSVGLGQWFTSRRRCLLGFHRSVERFNREWDRIVRDVDLESMNDMLSDYNEYYPLEKICAFGNEDIERLGFFATKPLTHEELHRHYPAIVLPTLRNSQ